MACRAANQQDLARSFAAAVPPRRLQDGAARVQPFGRERLVPVLESAAGPSSDRALAIFVLRLPGHSDNAIDLGLDVAESGVEETFTQPTAEFLARQSDIALAEPGRRCLLRVPRHRRAISLCLFQVARRA